MTVMHRLAIIDRGESAMRCISAVAELNRESADRITTIALCLRGTAAAIVREADEAMLLSPAAFAGTGRITAPASTGSAAGGADGGTCRRPLGGLGVHRRPSRACPVVRARGHHVRRSGE